jgi:glycosyltransferase involved in cell wall biosynthesis
MRAASPLPASATRRVLILEPDLDGHHAFWLALIIEAHVRAGWAVEVLTAPDPGPLRAQARLRGWDPAGLRLHALEAKGDGRRLDQARALAAATGAERIFVMFLDRFWVPLLVRAEAWAADSGPRLAGIWFHPHALDSHYRFAPPFGKRWSLRGRIHRFVRSRLAARLFTAIYFLLDEPAGRWRRLVPGTPAFVLPDPFERRPRLDATAARTELGLPPDRTIFLHLGSPERRKGLVETLAALDTLVADDRLPVERPPLLLRVGRNDRLIASERGRLQRLVAAGWVRTVEEFVPAEQLMEYFAASDWVLLPYRKFRYSSGILANAVGAGCPILAADQGHVGRVVAEAGLGRVYPPGTETLARAIGAALAPGAAVDAAPGLAAEAVRREPERLVGAMALSLAAGDASAPVLSVVIPVYQAERFLEAAVASVLAQPVALELILVEDGSPDGSAELCRRLAEGWANVRVLRHPGGVNRGAGASRNLGLEHAHGRYVAFLDADDRYLPERFTRHLARLDAEPAIDGVYGVVGVEAHADAGERGARATDTGVAAGVEPERLFEAMGPIGKRGHIHLDALTLRRDLVARIGLFPTDLELSQDTHFILRAALLGRLVGDGGTGPVAVRGVHAGNRIQDRAKLLRLRPALFASLFVWACERRVPVARRFALWRHWHDCAAEAGLPPGFWRRTLRADPCLPLRRRFWGRAWRAVNAESPRAEIPAPSGSQS